MLYQRKYIAILFVLVSPWLITLSGCNRYTESTGPTTPSDVQASPGDSRITLSWTAASDASSYNIYWSEVSGEGTSGTAISGIEEATYTLSELVNGTTYYFVVTSQEGSTESDPSNQVSAIPNKYIKVDSDGNELTSTASEWDCVLDSASGLLWEAKTVDGGLRDMFWNYTWYDSNPATNGGYAGSSSSVGYSGICFDDSNCDTEKYASQVNATGGICGYTDWRMPAEDDLAGLLTCYYYDCDTGLATGPKINQTFFPNTQGLYYWSSSVFASNLQVTDPDAFYNDSALNVNFGLGEETRSNKDARSLVRLVRGGQPLAIGIAGSGTVSDEPDVVVGCSADCTQYYRDGEVVTLTAIPPDQYYWAVKWSGCDSVTTTECTVTMSGARAVAVKITQTGVDLTKVDSSGVEVASDATEWDCVLDNASNLLWEVKTDDGDLRDTDWTYSWYDSNSATNGGDSGAANGGTCVDTTNCDTEKFTEQVNDSTVGICGYTDWRMPKQDELGGLLNCIFGEDCNAANAPLLDQAYFPNTQSEFYWSSTTQTDVDETAQGVYFSTGQATGLNKAEGNDVRLVRSVPPVLEPPRLSVTNAIETEITLNWNSVNETTSYNIYWSLTEGVGTSGTEISDIDETSYTLKELTAGNTYFFVVTSQRDLEESAASNQVSAMPGKYIKVDSVGDELPSTATEWDCVQDNETNLMWEVKTDDDRLRDTGWTYSWYDTDTDTNGGNDGTPDGGTCFDTPNCDTQKFAEQVNDSTVGICGYTDWRMPKQDELAGLLTCDYPDCLVGFDPYIDQAYFPYTQSNKYWSSSVYSSSASIEGEYAYVVDFGVLPVEQVFRCPLPFTGYCMVADKSSPENVRLVRDVK